MPDSKAPLFGVDTAVEPTGHRPGQPNDWYSKVGGKSQRTKNYRSKTPRGFARAVFEANARKVAST